jgi:hypothetical protein
VGSCIPVSKALRSFTPRGIRSYAGAQFAEDFECNRDLATITTLHVAKRLTADDLLHTRTDCLQSRGCPSHRWQASDFIVKNPPQSTFGFEWVVPQSSVNCRNRADDLRRACRLASSRYFTSKIGFNPMVTKAPSGSNCNYYRSPGST